MANLAIGLVPTTLVVIIGFGALVLFALSLFAKRQIFRVTLRSRRGPHFPIGNNAPRALCREIIRRLELTSRIKYEPKLLADDDYRLHKGAETRDKCTYLYRMRALDSYKQFEDLVKKEEPRLARNPNQPVREYVKQVKESPVTPMKGASAGLCGAFIDAYEHARYGYKSFGEAEYNNYMVLLHELMSSLIRHKTFKRRKPPGSHSVAHSSLSRKESTDRISNSSMGDSRPSSSIRSKSKVPGHIEMDVRGPSKRSAEAGSTAFRLSSDIHVDESKF